MPEYIPTIGIECHVQLKTKTKLFAPVANDARGAVPNTLISHICLGMPGALPVLNAEVVNVAIKAAYALNTEPESYSNFDRKHYFYPDLPKGYQISQFNYPIIAGGHIDIEVDGQAKRIGITRAHLEEDAGKSTHPAGKDYSLVDLNRAGTPLLEIVSEPEIANAAEARAYARELWLRMRYANVSDADLYYGNMRFDVNVSISDQPGILGTRTETKNLNSFRSVEKAIEYEIKRQTEVIEAGGSIVQETRGWDDDKMITISQRTKEDAHDYRYFPDPDIPPIVLDQTVVDRIKSEMPYMPSDVRTKLAALKIDRSAVESIVESQTAADIVMECFNKNVDQDSIRRIVLWIAGELQSYITKKQLKLSDLTLDIASLQALSVLVGDNKVSSTGAKSILLHMVEHGGKPDQIAQDLDLLQMSDNSEIEAIVDTVIAANPKAVEDIQAGEMKAAGFLVGQVMKQSKGKANPATVQQMIQSKLSQ